MFNFVESFAVPWLKPFNFVEGFAVLSLGLAVSKAHRLEAITC